MLDIIYTLSTKAGISPDMARRGMGAVLEICKNRMPPEAYSHLSHALPNADAMIAHAAASQPSPSQEISGGMITAVAGMIGKRLGVNDSGELVSKLSAIGFSPEQLQGFLPSVFDFLKEKVPPDALGGFRDMLPN